MSLLRARVKPAELPEGKVERLLAQLDDNRFAVRKKAAAELEALGPVAEQALQAALDGKPGPDLRRRLEELIGRIREQPVRGESLRGWRAVEVLEAVDTPEARAVLEKLARGAAAAPLTEEAKAAVRRLEGRAVAR